VCIEELFTRHSGLSWSLGSEEWRWTDEKWSSNRFDFPDWDPTSPFPSGGFIPTNLNIFTCNLQKLFDVVQSSFLKYKWWFKVHLLMDDKFYLIELLKDDTKCTCKLRHCEFFHLTESRSLTPITVPIYL